MHDPNDRMARNTTWRLVALACSTAALALGLAGSASADAVGKVEPVRIYTISAVAPQPTIAAADGAGWLLFRGHRSERSENLAPTSVPLAGVVDPDGAADSPVDALSRWGSVRAVNSAR